LPSLNAKALMQAHCHHRAIMKIGAEEEVLKKIGLDLETPDAGCCGMAGAFGFEREHYDVSMRVGERLILPKVREAAPETIVIADGFSCREQIAQSTPRQAMHFAQVLQMAMRGEAAAAYPEKQYVVETPPPDWRKALLNGAAIVGGFALFLDAHKGGCFSIAPAVPFAAKRRYVGATNVLETTFTCDGGEAKLIDLMPVMTEEEKRHRLTPFRQLLRRVGCVRGEVPMV